MHILTKGKTLMSNKDFIEKATQAVINYFNSHSDVTDKNNKIIDDDVYVVWLSKTLQNNKAMLSTTIPDGMYYEFTWNGDKNEGYLDVYKKWENITIH